MKTTFSISLAMACLALLLGCGNKTESKADKDNQPGKGKKDSKPKSSGGNQTSSGGNDLLTVTKKEPVGEDYIILDTLTDGFDRAKAKANVEDTLAKHQDIVCMVGLFEYNPPAILEALKQGDRLGKVKVVGFDENPATLQGIKDGTVHGTVVQNPYMYGYKSIEVLNELKKGNTKVIPENKFIDIPAEQIRADNVDEFWTQLKENLSGGADNPSKEGKPRFAFVSNGVAGFWTIASVGVGKAGQDLGVNTEVHMPAEGIPDQKRILEDLVTKKIDGIAVSPINPENQTGLLDEIAGKTLLITHDSDAPDAKRLVYVGMSNYDAGRLCGALVKEAIPQGGKVMIFVGRMEQDNARLRRQGVIDELLGRKPDPKRFDEPGKVLKGR